MVSAWVHPRVCGEAEIVTSPIVSKEGSIPACAGKPQGFRGGRLEGGVHPRVCGEAVGP